MKGTEKETEKWNVREDDGLKLAQSVAMEAIWCNLKEQHISTINQTILCVEHAGEEDRQ